MPRRLPQYVQAFTDRHGRHRHYFRRKGFKRTALPGLPWTPDFMLAYGEALQASELAAAKAAGTATQKKSNTPKAAAKPGSMSALIAEYRGSAHFGTFAAATKSNYNRLLDRLDQTTGALPVAKLTSAHVERMIDQRAATGGPEAGNSVRRILRLLMKLAVKRGYRADNPTLGVDKVQRAKSAKKGWDTLSEADISKFIAKFPLGTQQYLAMALLLCTGQRRSDVVALGPKNIVGDYDSTDFTGRQIGLTQKKTGKALVLPIAPMLAEALRAAAVPADATAFLRTRGRTPYTPESFSNLFSAWSKRAGITGQASPHTLRKAAATRLAEAGCSVHEIAAITGHDSLAEVERYTKAAGQEALAKRAMQQLQNPKGSPPPQS